MLLNVKMWCETDSCALGSLESAFPDGHVIQVIGWTSNYQETLRELGLEDEDVVFPQGPDRGYTLLVHRYIQRISTTLHTWFVNILEVGHNSLLCHLAWLRGKLGLSGSYCLHMCVLPNFNCVMNNDLPLP